MYDSAKATIQHSARVKHLMNALCHDLTDRAATHDASKLKSPEKEYFDRLTPKLKELKYGSEEYLASLKELGIALKHHYEVNPHHPEHHEDGVNGMTLVDVIEMLCDWIAAGERTKDGTIEKSLAINKERFGLSPQLIQILTNTANLLKGN